MPPKTNPRQEPAHDQSPACTAAAPMDLRDSINGLGFDLFNAGDSSENCNAFLSPYSIATALGMTYPGANGDTAEALAAVLRLKSENDSRSSEEAVLAGFSSLCDRFKSTTATSKNDVKDECPAVRVANCVWANAGQEVSPLFHDKVVKNFDGLITAVDFRNASSSACREINQWVEETTNNKIVDLLSEGALNKLTRMVLVNAIHFSAKFEHKFKKAMTVRGHHFHLLTDGGEVQDGKCHMMKQTAKLRYHEDETMQYVELPYVGRAMSLCVVVPKAVDGIHGVMKALSPSVLHEYHTDATTCDVVLCLPKFKVSGGGSVKPLLTALGLGVCFDEYAADFTRIFKEVPQDGLYMTDVVHKAFVEVNEEGTEAAAATAVIMGGRGGRARPLPPPKLVHVVVDRPSFVAITDHQTGIHLFVGKLMKPVIGM